MAPLSRTQLRILLGGPFDGGVSVACRFDSGGSRSSGDGFVRGALLASGSFHDFVGHTSVEFEGALSARCGPVERFRFRFPLSPLPSKRDRERR